MCRPVCTKLVDMLTKIVVSLCSGLTFEWDSIYWILNYLPILKQDNEAIPYETIYLKLSLIFIIFFF